MRLSLAERSPIYAWLSGLFAAEVDETTWHALRTPAVAEMLARVEPGFDAWVQEPFTATLREDLAADFAGLFLLPKGVPPFASAWIDGDREQLGATLSTLVLRSYEVLGLEPIQLEPWGKLPLDHVGLLFDLVARAAASADPLDRDVAEHLDREALGEWLVPFGGAMREQAGTPLYRSLGALLEAMHESSDISEEEALD